MFQRFKSSLIEEERKFILDLLEENKTEELIIEERIHNFWNDLKELTERELWIFKYCLAHAEAEHFANLVFAESLSKTFNFKLNINEKVD